MSWDFTRLHGRDREGYVVVEAITRGTAPQSPTWAQPCTFVCIDGKTYWVKASAQQGLVAELIAGRLAARTGAGPNARIIRVSEEIIPLNDPSAKLVGIVVGSEDQPETVNARSLQPLIQSGEFQPGSIDAMTRVRVIAFQTWIGASDAQVLVRLTDGVVMSIDHGDCFGATTAKSDPVTVLTHIPGVARTLGKDLFTVEEALRRVEAVTDSDLIEAVTQIPCGNHWRSPVSRRIEIAEWLAHRRDRLREVMQVWQQS